MTDKISSEDFIKAFGGGVKHKQALTDQYLKRTQGDLISRSALKEQVKNEICEVCFTSLDNRQCSSNCKLCTFNKLIDNAPPAEAYTKDEYEGAYLRGFADCYKLNGKPQETASEQERWLRGE